MLANVEKVVKCFALVKPILSIQEKKFKLGEYQILTAVSLAYRRLVLKGTEKMLKTIIRRKSENEIA